MNTPFSLVVVALLSISIYGLPSIGNAQTHTASVEDTVRDYFKDIPALIEIARCESEFRQFGDDGLVLKGGWGGAMVGVFQFYEAVHQASALALGMDLTTLEGNLAYARHLHAQQGTTPWNSAKECWADAVNDTVINTEDADLAELQAQINTLVKIVATLQELLAQKNALTLR